MFREPSIEQSIASEPTLPSESSVAQLSEVDTLTLPLNETVETLELDMSPSVEVIVEDDEIPVYAPESSSYPAETTLSVDRQEPAIDELDAPWTDPDAHTAPIPDALVESIPEPAEEALVLGEPEPTELLTSSGEPEVFDVEFGAEERSPEVVAEESPVDNTTERTQPFAYRAVRLEYYLIGDRLYTGQLTDEQLTQLQALVLVAQPEHLEQFVVEHQLESPSFLDPSDPGMREIITELQAEGRHEQRESQEDGVLVTIHTLDADNIRVTMESYPLISLPIPEDQNDSDDDDVVLAMLTEVSASDASTSESIQPARFYPTAELTDLFGELFGLPEEISIPALPARIVQTSESIWLPPAQPKSRPNAAHFDVLVSNPAPVVLPMQLEPLPVLVEIKPILAPTPVEHLPQPVLDTVIIEPEITVSPFVLHNALPGIAIHVDAPTMVIPEPQPVENPPLSILPTPPLRSSRPSHTIASTIERVPLERSAPTLPLPIQRQPVPTKPKSPVSYLSLPQRAAPTAERVEAIAAHAVKTSAKASTKGQSIATQFVAQESSRREASRSNAQRKTQRATHATNRITEVRAATVSNTYKEKTHTINQATVTKATTVRQKTARFLTQPTAQRVSRRIRRHEQAQHGRQAAQLTTRGAETTRVILQHVITQWANAQRDTQQSAPSLPEIFGDAPIAPRRVRPAQQLMRKIIGLGAAVQIQITQEALMIQPASTDGIERAKAATALAQLAGGAKQIPLLFSLTS